MTRKASWLLMTTVLTPAAYAQFVDTSEWLCEYCPFESGYRAETVVGVTSVSEDSAYIGNATGYDEQGVYANVDGDGRYRGDSYRLRWRVEDLGLDSRAAELHGARPGKFDFKLAYRETPGRRFDSTATVFTPSADGTLSLPTGWVAAPQTSGFAVLDASLRDRPIGSDRSVIDIGGRYFASERIRFSADYRRRESDGLKVQGGSSFTSASLLPMPFDYVTDEVDLGMRYSGDGGFVSLRWYLSDFENDAAGLRWQQPFSFSPPLGTGSFEQARAPDNRFRQLSVAAGYAFADDRTVLHASAGFGNIEQDAALLTYTTNANLSPGALPRATLDGDVDTTNIALALTSRPMDGLRVKISYRHDERDNKTAQALWERVIADNVLSGDPELNTPYGFERRALRLRADYDLFASLRVSGAYDRKEIDRDFQEVAGQTEDGGWGRLRWRPLPAIEVDVRGGTSQRDIDDYNEVFAASLGQNPLLRKYNLAYRYRRYGDLRLSWSPADLPVSVSLSGLVADDDYTRSELGITSADEFGITTDFSWSISERSTFYLNVGVESIESEQSGSEQFAAPDWQARHDDDFLTIGVGVAVRQLSERVDLRLDYRRSDGTTTIDVDTADPAAERFPDLESELDYLRLRLGYRHSERLGVNLDLRYQRFSTDDWGRVDAATVPQLLSLGASPYDDKSLIAGLGFRYRLGARPASPTRP